MKRRQALIDQVKEEYGNIANATSQQHFHQTGTATHTPEGYYEKLLGCVIEEIQGGTFDNCKSGTEIVNKVAANKEVLSGWKSE